jgi:uncharacterized protein with NRDE domain
MCLLAVFSRMHEAGPLVVAANRDEWLERPASPMEVLRGRDPRILGGRDLVARGTRLAVNEHGVFASLTNRRTEGGRDPSRQSRGELPLLLAGQGDARSAAAALEGEVRAERYSPCWIFVADRESLFYVDLTGAGAPRAAELAPGLHVLENVPLGAPSAKVDAVRAALTPAQDERQLQAVLASHETGACVHAGPFGTRTASIVVVPEAGRPRFHYTEGPPCRSALLDATPLWAT